MVSENPQLCIVLLNYRTPGRVIDCLNSLIAEASALNTKVLVVDNSSQDDSVSKIEAWITSNSASDTVSLIASEHNGGFSAGNNIGIRACDAQYYLLLNSDTLVRPGALTLLLNKMVSLPNVGLLSPRLEWPDEQSQESCFRYHHPVRELISSSGSGPILRLFPCREVAFRVSEDDTQPEWTSFACVMIRKQVFDQIGLLDEGYFMYYEDVEFCYRAREAGWEVYNHPLAKVVHLRGGSSSVKSSSKAKKRLPGYYYESRTRYFHRVYGRGGLLSANLLWTLGWLLAQTRGLFQRSFHPPACHRQWLDIWTNFLAPTKPYVHPENYAKKAVKTK